MKSLAVLLTGLVLGLALTVGVPGLAAPPAATPALADGLHPAPEATRSTPKPGRGSATPTPTPAPVASARTTIDEEGERWVQLAGWVGGGLLAVVLLIFALGAAVRHRARRGN